MSHFPLTTKRLLRWLTPIFIFALLWLPRAFQLTEFVTPDEPRWLTRSANFYQALHVGDLAATYQTEHPGVTTMWTGLIGFVLAFPDYPAVVAEQIGTTDDPIKGVLESHGHTPLELLGSARGVVALIVSLMLTITLLMVIRRLGWPCGLTATALIAFDPFLLAHSRLLHTDALLTSFVMLALAAFVFSRQSARPGTYLILSGVGSGLALLTKTPGVLIVGYIGLLHLLLTLPALVQRWREQDFLGGLWRLLVRPIIPWAGAALATFVLLWPALWVRPLSVLQQMIVESQSYAGEGHSSPLFYLGELKWGNPGPSFYGLTYLWRTTPLTLAGLGLLFLCSLSQPFRFRQEPRLWLRSVQFVGFALFFGVALGFGAKKFDRYLLPAFPALAIGAAAGWVWLISSLKRFVPAGRVEWLWGMLIGVILVGQALLTLPTFPYYLTYYNPIMKATQDLTDEMLVGWGEGIDVAARHIAAQPHAKEARVASWYTHGVSSWLHPGIPISTEKFWQADYLILYQNQIQRQMPARQMLLHYLRQEPSKRVTLSGIDYSWLYWIDDVALPPYVVEWNQQIRLVNYTLTAGDITAGQEVELALYLQNRAPIEENLNILVRIVNIDGVEIERAERWPFGSSTKSWQQDELWVDRIKFHLPQDIPPGLYRVEVSFYVPESLQRLPITSVATGEPVGDPLLLDYLSVNLLEKSQSQLNESVVGPLLFGQQLLLHSFEALEEPSSSLSAQSSSPSLKAHPGQSVQLNALWQSRQMIEEPLTGFVHLVGPSGQLVAQDDHPLAGGFIPSTMWSAWQLLPDRYFLKLPEDAELGEYTLYIGVYNPNTGERLLFEHDGQSQDAFKWGSLLLTEIE